MFLRQRGVRLALGALVFLGVLACRTADVFVAQATMTPTRTPRPTFTPLPSPTLTPLPSPTKPPPPTATRTPTRRPPTARPPTQPPAPIVQPTAPPAPPVSQYEYHVNPPRCEHSGITYLKGIVYSDKNDPNSRYAGAIVALGSPDGSAIYDKVKTDGNGEYTFILSNPGEPGRKGNWGLWLVDPSDRRKSDIGGPITTNGLPPDAPGSCWAGGVDFWK